MMNNIKTNDDSFKAAKRILEGRYNKPTTRLNENKNSKKTKIFVLLNHDDSFISDEGSSLSSIHKTKDGARAEMKRQIKVSKEENNNKIRGYDYGNLSSDDFTIETETLTGNLQNNVVFVVTSDLQDPDDFMSFYATMSDAQEDIKEIAYGPDYMDDPDFDPEDFNGPPIDTFKITKYPILN